MPRTVTERASAKVNLALRVLGRRSDGYHELDSIVAFAEGAADVVTVAAADKPSFTVNGPYADDVPPDATNLVTVACQELIHLYALHGVALSPLEISLEKNLPVASGIGGGSADAAAAMRALVTLAGVDLPKAELQATALAIGADVPVCLYNKACQMQGVGEVLLPLPQRVPPAIVLVNPRCALSTRDVFADLALLPGQRFSEPLDVGSLESWGNDLMPPALKLLPEIETVLAALREEPLLSSIRMSGSGATCFGLAQSLADAESAAQNIALAHPEWWVRASALR
jgi:4-diphosphocytidyl-2-C-methyl-D-erythritol kinase